MSSYNDYDGIPVSGSHEMLIDRLRTRWGFRGYVVSDSNAVSYLYSKQHVAASQEDALGLFLREGGNVRTEFTSPENLVLPVRRLVRSGNLDTAVMDARVKFLVGLFPKPLTETTRDRSGPTDGPVISILEGIRAIQPLFWRCGSEVSGPGLRWRRFFSGITTRLGACR